MGRYYNMHQLTTGYFNLVKPMVALTTKMLIIAYEVWLAVIIHITDLTLEFVGEVVREYRKSK
jgi:hypothetical protein